MKENVIYFLNLYQKYYDNNNKLFFFIWGFSLVVYIVNSALLYIFNNNKISFLFLENVFYKIKLYFRNLKRIQKINILLKSLNFFFLYLFFIYDFFLFFFKLKINYYFKTIGRALFFIIIKIPLLFGKFATYVIFNFLIFLPYIFLRYVITFWWAYFFIFSLFLIFFVYCINVYFNNSALDLYFYKQEDLNFLNFNLYNFLNPSFFNEVFPKYYNSNIENFFERNDSFFSNLNSIGTLKFVNDYYISKNNFITKYLFNSNSISFLNSLYFLEKTVPTARFNINPELQKVNDFFYFYTAKEHEQAFSNSKFIEYSFLKKIKSLNLLQHKQIYSKYLNASFFQLNTTNADWFQLKSMYTNNWLSSQEIKFYLTNSVFLEFLNFIKFIIFYLLNCIFPSDIIFVWLKYLCLNKICVFLNFLSNYITSSSFTKLSEVIIKVCIFSIPDNFLFDLGYVYKIQIYSLINIMFDHLFGLCLKIYKIYNVNIGNHSSTKKLILLFTDAGLQFKNVIQEGDLLNKRKMELTLYQFPFLAQYNESDLMQFSTYSFYTNWRRYCYVIEGSPFFQEQTNIHNYTSKSNPAGLDDEIEHLDFQNKLIVPEFMATQATPQFNYWSFWSDLNINFDNFDKDYFIKQNVLKGNVFPGNLYDSFEFNNIPFFGGDKIILFKTFPTEMSSKFENFFSYGNISTKLRFHKTFVGNAYLTGETENSRLNHNTTLGLRRHVNFSKYLKNLINLELYNTNTSFYNNNIYTKINFNYDVSFNFQNQLTTKDFQELIKVISNNNSYSELIIDFYKKYNKNNLIFSKQDVKKNQLLSEVFRLLQVQVSNLFFHLHNKQSVVYSSEQTLSTNVFLYLDNVFQTNIDNLSNDSETFNYKKLNLTEFQTIEKYTKKVMLRQILRDEKEAEEDIIDEPLIYEANRKLESFKENDSHEDRDVDLNFLKFVTYKNQKRLENLYSNFFSTFKNLDAFFLLMNKDSNFFLEYNRLTSGLPTFSQDLKHTSHILEEYYKDSSLLKKPTVNTNSLFFFWLKSLDSDLFISKELGRYQMHNELIFPSFRSKTLLSNMYTLQIYFFFYLLLHFISIIITFYIEVIKFIFFFISDINFNVIYYLFFFYFLTRFLLILYYILYLNLKKIEYNSKKNHNFEKNLYFFRIIKFKLFFDNWVLAPSSKSNLISIFFQKRYFIMILYILLLLIFEFIFFVLNFFFFIVNYIFKKLISYFQKFFFKMFLSFGIFNKIFLFFFFNFNLLLSLLKKNKLYILFICFHFIFSSLYLIIKFLFFRILSPLFLFSFFWYFIKSFLHLYNLELSDLYTTYLMLVNIFFILFFLSLLSKNFKYLFFENKFKDLDINFDSQEDLYESKNYNDTNPEEVLAANHDNFENTENVYWETLYYHPQPEKMAKDFFITDEGFLISDMVRNSKNFYDLILLRKLNMFFFEKIKINSYSEFLIKKNLNTFYKNMSLAFFYELHYRFFSVTVYFFTYVLVHLKKIKGFEQRFFQYKSFIYIFWYKFQEENLEKTKDLDVDEFNFNLFFFDFKRTPFYFKQRILASDNLIAEEESFFKNDFFDDLFLIKFFDLDTTDQNPIILNKNNKIFDLSLYYPKRLNFLFDDILDTNSLLLRKFLLNGYINSNKYSNISILSNPNSFIKDNSFLNVEEDELFLFFDLELGLNVDYLDYYFQFYLGFQTKFNFSNSFGSFYIKIVNPFELYDNKFKYKFFSNIKFYINYLNLSNFPNLTKKEFEKVLIELNCTEQEWDSLEVKKKYIIFPFSVIEFTIFCLFFFNFFLTSNNESHLWSLLINPLDVRSEDEAVILENSLLENLNLSEPSIFSTQFFEFCIFYIQSSFDRIILAFSLPGYVHENLWFFYKEFFFIFYFVCTLLDYLNLCFGLNLQFPVNSLYYIDFVEFLFYFQIFFSRIFYGFFFYDLFFLFINFFNIYLYNIVFLVYLFLYLVINLLIIIFVCFLIYILLCFLYFYILYKRRK